MCLAVLNVNCEENNVKMMVRKRRNQVGLRFQHVLFATYVTSGIDHQLVCDLEVDQGCRLGQLFG